MSEPYERHLELEQDRRDRILGQWWCEGQAAIGDDQDDEERDLAIDDELLDHGSWFDDQGRQIEDVQTRGELL